jgi:antitoxin FitA
MTNITIHQLEPQLLRRLQERAQQNGRAIEAEITAILASVLIPEPSPPREPNLATAIKQRFAEVGGVDLPEIPREPIRNPPTF